MGCASLLISIHQKLPTVEVNVVPLYERQFNSYLKEPGLPRVITDIYAKWHCSQYPLLEAAASKYLSAPPNSVASGCW